MASTQVVEALGEFKDRPLGLSQAVKAAALQQLTFQRGKETLAERVVIAITG